MKENGYTLIELMIAVMIVGILASFAVSTYASYTVKTQVAVGISEATGVTRAVEDYYAARGILPVNNTQAGVSAPEDFSSNYVQSISVSQGGNVTIEYGNRASDSILESKLTFYVALSPNGKLTWICGEATPQGDAIIQNHDTLLQDVSPRYLPASCLAS